MSVNFDLGTLKNYVAIDEDDLYEPEITSDSRVSNQDLKGTIFQNRSNEFEDVDYLILTNSDFMNAASELAGFCLLYTSPSPRDKRQSRMPSSA